jgi:hypothetical protein
MDRLKEIKVEERKINLLKSCNICGDNQSPMIEILNKGLKKWRCIPCFRKYML